MDLFDFIDKIGGPQAIMKVLTGLMPFEKFAEKAEPGFKDLILSNSPKFKPKIVEFINKLHEKQEGEVKTAILISENAGEIFLTTVMLDENSQITRACSSIDIEKFIINLDIKKLLGNGTDK
jgi:hypothetical protein